MSDNSALSVENKAGFSVKNIFWNSQENRLRFGFRFLGLFVFVAGTMIPVEVVVNWFVELGLLNPISLDTGQGRLVVTGTVLVRVTLSMWLASRFLDRRLFSDYGYRLNRKWWTDFAFGAISYILKDTKIEEVVKAIYRAAQGEATLHPLVATRIIQEVHGGKGDKVNPFTELTKREMEVLTLIASGMSNLDIAEQLVISISTVKGHVSNILSKLNLADRTQAAVYAWLQGIISQD